MITHPTIAPSRSTLQRCLATLAVIAAIVALQPHANAQRNQPSTSANENAAQLSARAFAPQPRTDIGSQVPFFIQVEGVTEAPPIELGDIVDGLRIEYLSSSQRREQSMRIINGRRTQIQSVSTTLQYAITPLRAGRYTIPAIEFEINDQTLRTNPVTIQATPARQRNDIRATLELDHTTAVVGQPITASLHIDAVPELLSIPNIITPDTIENARAFPLPPEKVSADPTSLNARRAIEQVVEINRGNNNTQPAIASFLGQDAYLKRSQIELTEQPALRWTLRVILVPTRPGIITIDPIIVRAEFSAGNRRDPFGRLVQVPQAITLQTQPQTITANPLPPDPSPLAESPWEPTLDLPLVGRFNIQSTATPTTANVGDPIELTLAITGWEPIKRIGRLNLSNIDSLNRRFRLPRESIAPERNDLALRFSAQIRAADEQAQQFPPIAFRAYDPIERTWTTIQSEPINLNIRPTRVVRAGDVITPTAPNPASSLDPADNPSTLAPIAVSPSILTQRAFTIDTVLNSPAVLAALAVPPATCAAAAILLAAIRRTGNRPKSLSPKAAASKALAQLNTIDPASPPQAAAETISAILRQYIADRAPTHAHIQEPPQPLKPILHACDEARFGSAHTTNTSELITQAQAAIKEASNQ